MFGFDGATSVVVMVVVDMINVERERQSRLNKLVVAMERVFNRPSNKPKRDHTTGSRRTEGTRGTGKEEE